MNVRELYRSGPKRRQFFSAYGSFIVIGAVTFYIFFDFFTKGYVMDGLYDRRNNVLPYYYIFSRAVAGLHLPAHAMNVPS